MTATRRRAAITPTINDNLIGSDRAALRGPPASHQRAWEGSWLPGPQQAAAADSGLPQGRTRTAAGNQPAARRRRSGPVEHVPPASPR